MSMISAQIDELREMVGDGSMEWVAGPVRASVLREAADTIWQLRDDLQQANAENAKLRESNDMLAKLLGDRSADAYKLRGLVLDMWHELDAATQYDAGGGRGAVYEFERRMRELGIEVNG